ncbi:MAG: tRNA 2-selenouridine(34) synthase MnmH [Saprospirales bacterium]|nr:tRNA 2-selenouridine(34) synthase MnmH [Saprospirales bacterium]
MIEPVEKVDVPEFLDEAAQRVILDVRTPAEFEQGHIPGASNMPLFTNEERAEIGTLYKQVSKENAFKRGLELVGPRLTAYIEQAAQYSPGKVVGVHCWRGGQRSASIAQLLVYSGFDVKVLRGGYKAFRNYVLRAFSDWDYKLVVLGGKTGSGKTDILHQLRSEGEQVLDLEGLAHHKGSAFGALGQEPQPSVEHFENELFSQLKQFDFSRRIWVENESRTIGRIFIPQGFWDKKVSSPLIHIEVPFEIRVERLMKEYAHFPKEHLMEALSKIQKRMGPQHVKAAKEAMAAGDLKTATELALHYYDKAYLMATAKGNFSQEFHPEFNTNDSREIARSLIQFANEHEL